MNIWAGERKTVQIVKDFLFMFKSKAKTLIDFLNDVSLSSLCHRLDMWSIIQLRPLFCFVFLHSDDLVQHLDWNCSESSAACMTTSIRNVKVRGSNMQQTREKYSPNGDDNHSLTSRRRRAKSSDGSQFVEDEGTKPIWSSSSFFRYSVAHESSLPLTHLLFQLFEGWCRNETQKYFFSCFQFEQ